MTQDEYDDEKAPSRGPGISSPKGNHILVEASDEEDDAPENTLRLRGGAEISGPLDPNKMTSAKQNPKRPSSFIAPMPKGALPRKMSPENRKRRESVERGRSSTRRSRSRSRSTSGSPSTSDAVRRKKADQVRKDTLARVMQAGPSGTEQEDRPSPPLPVQHEGVAVENAQNDLQGHQIDDLPLDTDLGALNLNAIGGNGEAIDQVDNQLEQQPPVAPGEQSEEPEEQEEVEVPMPPSGQPDPLPQDTPPENQDEAQPEIPVSPPRVSPPALSPPSVPRRPHGRQRPARRDLHHVPRSPSHSPASPPLSSTNPNQRPSSPRDDPTQSQPAEPENSGRGEEEEGEEEDVEPEEQPTDDQPSGIPVSQPGGPTQTSSRTPTGSRGRLSDSRTPSSNWTSRGSPIEWEYIDHLNIKYSE